VPKGVKHNKIDESECIRSGLKKNQDTKIIQNNKRISLYAYAY
jgi:hypothetical protein